mgnify:FL=1
MGKNSILHLDAPLPRFCVLQRLETTEALKPLLFVSVYVYLLKSNDEVSYLMAQTRTHHPMANKLRFAYC